MSKEKLFLAVRIASAALGGYALSAGICLWLGWLLDLGDRDLRSFVNVTFYLFYLLIVLAAFAFRSHLKTAGVLLGSNLLLWAGWLAVKGG